MHRETERKETRGGRKEKRGRKKKEGRKVKRGGRNEKRGGSSCGETDSTGHTKTASTTSEDTSPNSILFRAINIIKKETKLCVIVFHKIAV